MNARTDPGRTATASRDGRDRSGGTSDDFLVRSPREIARVLRQLADSRTLLRVHLSGHGEVYSSALLAVEADPEPALCLDELVPEEGHRRVEVGTRMWVHARLGGVPLQFVSEVASVAAENGVAIYRVAPPAELDYRQRRADFRAMVGHARPVPVRLQDTEGNGESFDAELHDISVGGVALRLDSKTAQQIKSLTSATLQCDATLPNGNDIRCRVEVRHVHPAPTGTKGAILGGCFTALDRSARIALQRYIAELGREMLRTRARS